jgi:vacuolar-type H+-ATPase subunit H
MITYMLLSRVVALLLLAPVISAAQKMDPFDYEVANVSLLQAKPLQKELGVSELHRTAMNKIADQFNVQIKALLEKMQKESGGKPPNESDPKLVAAYDKLKEGVLKQLTPQQLRRLREITLQQVGLPALGDTVVAKRVGISDAQIKKIRGIYDEALKRASKLEDDALEAAMKDLKAKKPKTEKEAREIMDEANKRAEAVHKRIDPQIRKMRLDAEAKVLATMSPTQKAAWENLKGRKFDPPK